LIEETTALNVSIERIKTIGCGSPSRYHTRKKPLLSLSRLTRKDNEMFSWCGLADRSKDGQLVVV
jgi:hypothetical protein